MAQYYCLISGLIDYGFDSDRKTLNFTAIREELMSSITEGDSLKMESLMNFYDIANIVAATSENGGRFSQLGALDEESVAIISKLLTSKEGFYRDEYPDLKMPKFIEIALDEEKVEARGINPKQPLENLLYTLYFNEMASETGFLSEYSQLELNIRNIAATVKSKSMGLDPTKYLIGSSDVVEQLLSSQSPDFGLKSDIPYIDDLMAILSSDNILKKERDLDMLRISMIDEINTFNYFTIDTVMGYYMKIAMIERWLALDPEEGRTIFEKIVKSLSDMDFTDKIAEELK